MQSEFRSAGDGSLYVVKRAADVLEYSLAWGDWLGACVPADTLSGVSWSAEPGLTVVSSALQSGAVTLPDASILPANTVATVFLSGGTAGQNYTVTATATTAGGRTKAFAFDVWVRA